jgi:hypothetical protein
LHPFAGYDFAGVTFEWSSLIDALDHGLLNVLRCVPCTPRVSVRMTGIMFGRPSSAEFADFVNLEIQRQPQQLIGLPDAAPARPSEFHPLAMVRFVRAARHLRRLDRAAIANKDFLEASYPDDYNELLKHSQAWPAKTYLTESRVIFDMAMMLLMRNAYHGHFERDSEFWLYLFADGSPASGFEAFVAIEQMVKDFCYAVRVLPVVYLGYGHMSLADKVFSYLWTLFLETGPFVDRLRWRLARVRGWTTDWGVESGICDVEDLLPAFLAVIGVAGFVPKLRFLFPNAIWFPGWHHLWDGISSTVFCEIKWFPQWLTDLKDIVKFFRVDSYRQVLIAIACAAGLDTSDLKSTPPSFANWRWGTLFLVLSWVLPVKHLLTECVRTNLFKKCKENALMQSAVRSCQSVLFWQKFRVVWDITARLHACRTWGAGCDCCDERRRNGEVVTCPKQGRRLPKALQRVLDFQKECIALRGRPAPGDMCDGQMLPAALEDCRSWAFEFCSASAGRKTAFLKCSPWALARARDAAVLAECREEFRRTPEGKRHKISSLWFANGSELSRQCDEYISDGVLGVELASELRSVEDMPITEECVERPHSLMNREKLRQRASTRAWQSCTLRLDDNFKLFDVCQNLREHFVGDWGRVKRLVQTDPALTMQPARISFARLKTMVYRTSVDVPCFVGVQAKSGMEAEARGGGLPTSDAIHSEFIRACLRTGEYYTIGPTESDSESVPLQCFKVVWLVPKSKKFVRTALEETNRTIDIAVLKLGIWLPPAELGDESELNVFSLGDPEFVDMFKLASWTTLRHHFRSWSHEPSDVDACVRLFAPTIAKPIMSPLGLADPHVPLQLLLEELKRVGWTISTLERPAATLTTAFPGVFSVAKWKAKDRAYFQCLVFLPALFDKGLASLSHSQCSGYYRLLLRSEQPGMVAIGDLAAVYTEALVHTSGQRTLAIVNRDEDGLVFSGDEGENSGADVPAPPPAIFEIVADAGLVYSDDDGAPAVAALAPRDGSVTSSSSSSASSLSALGDEGVVMDVALPAGVLRTIHIGDIVISPDKHVSKVSVVKDYLRLKVVCRLHPKCNKKRGVGFRQTAVLGELEPYAYLMAWCLAGGEYASARAHNLHRPIAAELQASWIELSGLVH